MYGEGISREGEIIDLGGSAEHHREVRRLVRLQGRAHRPGQGQRREFLRENPELAREIEGQIREKLLPPKVPRSSNGNGEQANSA